MKQITVGIIGAGRIGKLHAENLVRMPGVVVKAITDPFIENNREWAEKLGIKVIAESHEAIMTDSEINAVFVCSPTDTHVQLIEEAASSGKHVFCEKPISFSDEASLSAYKVAQKHGIKVQVGFNRRFDRNFALLKRMVEQGEIGNLHMIKIQSRDPEPPSLEYVSRSGGMFMDMSIHDFDMARFLSGSDIIEVYVQGAALVNPDIKELGDIDTAIISLKFANGVIGVIDNSREAVYGYDQQAEVFGSQGSARCENETENRVILSKKDQIVSANPLHFFLERYNDAYVSETSQFIDAIRYDKEITCSLADGIMAQRVAAACLASLKSGKPEKVELSLT